VRRARTTERENIPVMCKILSEKADGDSYERSRQGPQFITTSITLVDVQDIKRCTTMTTRNFQSTPESPSILIVGGPLS
jgi:hypothetical protein